MTFPLDFWQISLITAITAIILLITSEMLSPYYGKVNIPINKKRLKQSSMVFSVIFLGTVALRIIEILLS